MNRVSPGGGELIALPCPQNRAYHTPPPPPHSGPTQPSGDHDETIMDRRGAARSDVGGGFGGAVVPERNRLSAGTHRHRKGLHPNAAAVVVIAAAVVEGKQPTTGSVPALAVLTAEAVLRRNVMRSTSPLTLSTRQRSWWYLLLFVSSTLQSPLEKRESKSCSLYLTIDAEQGAWEAPTFGLCLPAAGRILLKCRRQ